MAAIELSMALGAVGSKLDASCPAVVHSRWRVPCVCRCGRSFTARALDIKRGFTSSCGCLKSKIELELLDFVRSQCPEALHNTRSVIPPYEIDVYVPGKLAIELHGLYWHGDRVLGKRARTDSLNKMRAMEEKDLPGRFIFFEDEWRERRTAVEGFVSSALGAKTRLGARKCELSNPGARDFIAKHHIQGAPSRRDECWALASAGQVVAAASFRERGAKSGTSGDWELTRYCVSAVVSVTGGLSKLLSHFWASHPNAIRLVTFADKRLSRGELYRAAGFYQSGEVPPRYWYVRGAKRYHRFKYRKDALAKMGWLKDGETERACMRRRHFDRVWDAGKVRWEIGRPGRSL